MKVLFISGRTIDGLGNREVVSAEDIAIIVERFDFGLLIRKSDDPYRSLNPPKMCDVKVPPRWKEMDAVVVYIPDAFPGPERFADVAAIWGCAVQMMERARMHAFTLICPMDDLDRISASLNLVREGRWIKVRYCERGGDVTLKKLIQSFLEKGYEEMEQDFSRLRQSWPGKREDIP